jgi:hypothetical protein
MSIQFIMEKINRNAGDDWFSLHYKDEEKVDSVGSSLYDGNSSTRKIYTKKVTDGLVSEQGDGYRNSF